MNVTYSVPGVDDVAVALVPYPTPPDEDVVTWEVLLDAGRSNEEILGTVSLNSDGTYYVYGGGLDDVVELDQVSPNELEAVVLEFYYADYGVPIKGSGGDHVAVITTDEDAASATHYDRLTAVRVPAETNDRYRSDNEVLGYVENDGEAGLFYGVDEETGATTHGYLSPFLAGHAIVNELGD